jgi:hypothetical protein
MKKDKYKINLSFNTLQKEINPLTCSPYITFFFEKLLGLHLVLPKDVSLILYHDLMKEQKS